MAKAGKEDVDAHQLAKELDDKLDDYIDSLPKRKYKDGLSPDNWEEEIEKIPLFMTSVPENIEDNPELVALQQIKFQNEESTREDDALTHKIDGNQWFKKKMYKQALKAYSEGLKQKCNNVDVNAVLYTNRAAANFRLGNHRSSLNDAAEALNLKPDHMKALVRAVECSMNLKEYTEAVQWCDRGLQSIPNDTKLLDYRVQAYKLKKAADREKRKKHIEEKKQRAAEEKLVAAIKARNIRLWKETSEEGDQEEDPTKAFVASLVSNEPSGRTTVSLDNVGTLHWPVRFLYPEHGNSDLISAFNENSRFVDHFDVMFSVEAEPHHWNPDRKYRPENLQVYFEDFDVCSLVEVKPEETLAKVLQHPRCRIEGGIPAFYILSKATSFRDQFLKKYAK